MLSYDTKPKNGCDFLKSLATFGIIKIQIQHFGKGEPIVERKQNGKKKFCVCVQLANFFSAAKREKPTAT